MTSSEPESAYSRHLGRLLVDSAYAAGYAQGLAGGDALASPMGDPKGGDWGDGWRVGHTHLPGATGRTSFMAEMIDFEFGVASAGNIPLGLRLIVVNRSVGEIDHVELHGWASGSTWSSRIDDPIASGRVFRFDVAPNELLISSGTEVHAAVTFTDRDGERWVKYAGNEGPSVYDGNPATIFRRWERFPAASIGEELDDSLDYGSLEAGEEVGSDPSPQPVVVRVAVSRVESMANNHDRLMLAIDGIEPIVGELERILQSDHLPEEAGLAIEANRSMLAMIMKDPDPSPVVLEGLLVRAAQLVRDWSGEPQKAAERASAAGSAPEEAEAVRNLVESVLEELGSLDAENPDGGLDQFVVFLESEKATVDEAPPTPGFARRLAGNVSEGVNSGAKEGAHKATSRIIQTVGVGGAGALLVWISGVSDSSVLRGFLKVIAALMKQSTSP